MMASLKFNINLKMKRNNKDEYIIIRFPSPRKVYSLWQKEKVKNEVMVINYVYEYTNILIPYIRYWSLIEKSL